MRVLCFLPLTYVAGIEGFEWFMPYLLVIGGIAVLLAKKRSNSTRRPAPESGATPAAREAVPA